MEKRRPHSEFGVDGCAKTQKTSSEPAAQNNNQGHLEQEKRVRREIANSNERRRMQSINAGFDTLRILLPPIPDGEKMSKATILQLTAKYINTLLVRVNLLENEVAIYRQSAGIQPGPPLPDITGSLSLARKRKADDQKKRADCVRVRRRRTELNTTFESSAKLNYLHCSPESTDTHQTSPSNSFTGSLSVSPTSPQPESTSSTAACLEHLVMAIEQIEGGGALNVSPQPESHDGSFSTVDQSPSLPSETYWQSPQENYHGYAYTESQTSNHKSNLNIFSDVIMLTPVNDNNHVQSNTDDYPIVAKLLNRPIPHKYLHRPQVVVNSSH